MDTANIAKTQKLLKEWPYNWTPLDKGYTDKILYINVGSAEIKEKAVPPLMKEKFIGGRGYGLRLLWDATKPDTKWDDPDNGSISLQDDRRYYAIFRNRKINMRFNF
jgi:aldehyde:ferredoxin oxidoreductase